MDINYLLWLQGLRGGFIDTVLLTVTEFITSPVMYIFIALIYWCMNKRAAIFLAMNISFGSMLNQTLKNVFCVYRPWIKSTDIIPPEAAKDGATGYSFPSGHTQIASSEFLSIAIWQKKRKWAVAVCIFMTLLIMFTRNYLGVHTPQDVIVSLAVSCIVIFADSNLLKWIDNGKSRDIVVFLTGVAITSILLLYLTYKPYPLDYSADGALLVDPKEMIGDCYTAAGCVFGFLIGWIAERRFVGFSTDAPKKMLIKRGIVGAVTLLIYVVLTMNLLTSIHPYWGEFMFIMLAFIYILFIYPYLFTKWEMRGKNNG